MMTMFCGTIMLIITFLHSVKSGYSPMNRVHYTKLTQIFQSFILFYHTVVVFRSRLKLKFKALVEPNGDSTHSQQHRQTDIKAKPTETSPTAGTTNMLCLIFH